MKNLTHLNLSSLFSKSGMALKPDLSSETGKHVCPAKSSFSDLSYSRTSILSKASSCYFQIELKLLIPNRCPIIVNYLRLLLARISWHSNNINLQSNYLSIPRIQSTKSYNIYVYIYIYTYTHTRN